MAVPSGIMEHWNPGRLIFGVNSLSKIPSELESFGKPLVLTDQGIKKVGVLEKIENILKASKVTFEVFDSVPSDPPIKVIETAFDFFKKKGCSSVIGLGGGSCLDAAKAVALIASTGNTMATYRDGRVVTEDLIPVVAIPTTAGTGSEVTGTTVISDEENNIKLAIKGRPLVPKMAVLDPTLLLGIPSKIAAATGADALIHAMEAYFSINSNLVTDGLALQSIRLISNHLKAFVEDTHNLEHAYPMLMGSTIAGLAFSNAGLGLVHSLAHPLGAFYHVHHGLACAAYLIPVLEFNKPDCLQKFATLAGALDSSNPCLGPEDASRFVIDFVETLFDDIGIPRKAQDLGLDDWDIHEKMVDDAFAASPTKVNPRKASKEEIRALFKSIS